MRILGRFLRTTARLHPLQIAARPAHAILARAVRDVPSALAPRVRGEWPEAPDALRRLANAERSRAGERLLRLPVGSALASFEACYGLELGADDHEPAADWSPKVAVAPYPASVRARRIAVAVRCGRPVPAAELARAARAVLLQPELHLLGNHLLENGFGLACAGAAAIGREADVWWAVGRLLIDWQLPWQFLGDGGHIERSASYHVALTAALLETIEIADASGRGAPPAWRSQAARALGWMRAVQAPDGSYPLFNDAAIDAAPTIADTIAFAAALGIVPGDVRLDPTGWLALDVADAHMIVDAGPDAIGWQPGHAHADGLTFELWVGGERAVVDFGVASYEPGPARVETRATRSHNTVEVAGEDSCEVWDAFRVGRRGRGRVADLAAHATTVRAKLAHDGYAWLPGSPHHERELTLQPGRLEIRDRVAGARAAWTTRLRLDACTRVRVRGSSEVVRRQDRWHPRHGDPRDALVFEQRAPDAHGSVTWVLEW